MGGQEGRSPKGQKMNFDCAFPKYYNKIHKDVSSSPSTALNTLVRNRRPNWAQLNSKFAKKELATARGTGDRFAKIPISLAVGS